MPRRAPPSTVFVWAFWLPPSMRTTCVRWLDQDRVKSARGEGGREQPGGKSVDLSATGHCRLAHANELQMSGHARFPGIRVLWMVGAVVNDNVLEIEGA